MPKRKGKFIVIEGGDGAGKATQAKLLIKYLKNQGKKVHLLDFPQYETSFFGKLIGRFLNGEFGNIYEVSPYLISLAFAADRFLTKDKINKWLDQGDWIISNRYVSSNLAHQAAKVFGAEQNKLIRWLEQLEYEEYGVPREDLVIFLHVPVKIARNLVDKKASRKHLHGKKADIAERNLKHQQRAVEVYQKLCQRKKHWLKVECVNKNGELLSIAKIHQKLIKKLEMKKLL